MKNNMDDKIYVQKNHIKSFDNVLGFMCEKIKNPLKMIPDYIKSSAIEIRLRVNQGISIICPRATYFLKSDGQISDCLSEDLLKVNKQDLSDCFNAMCDYSIYSFREQIKNGFITFKGGNRIGICGSAVLSDDNVSHIKDITSLNIRIAKEFKGCAKDIFENIKSDSSGVLIAGPPACGKTTILRDLARMLSTDMFSFKKIVIVDERFEIAAVFEGIPQLDVGLSDVLTGFSKSEGILKAVRCLSPDVIICDEIGSEEDASAITQSLNAGVQIIASIHAGNIDELMNKPQVKKILKSGAFEKIIFLESTFFPKNTFKIYKVSDFYDKNYRNNNFSNIRSFRRLCSI